MAKAPKTCKGCVSSRVEEIVPAHSVAWCDLKGKRISLSDKACEAAEGKPRRRR